MKYEFDPRYPDQTAADVSYSLSMLACFFAAVKQDELDLTENACCGLMLQLFAMARAMEELEDYLGALGAEKARAGAAK